MFCLNLYPKCRMSARITLFCLIHGERSHSAFSVQIDKTETVSMLKELIVGKNPNYFNGIDPRQLSLWQVCTWNRDEDCLRLARLDEFLILHPTLKIGEAFPKEPDGENIHIIVKVPKPGTSSSLHNTIPCANIIKSNPRDN